MFADSVWSYMLLVALGVVIMSFVGQYLVNRMHEPYMEETEDRYIVHLYRTARQGGSYHDYTFTERDGRFAYVPKMTRILFYGVCMIAAAVMVHHSFSQSGRAPEETINFLLSFGVMMLGVALTGPVMAYNVLRKEH